MDNVMYTATLSSVVQREEFENFVSLQENLHVQDREQIMLVMDRCRAECNHLMTCLTEVAEKLDNLTEHNRQLEEELHYERYNSEKRTRRFRWLLSAATIAIAVLTVLVIL